MDKKLTVRCRSNKPYLKEDRNGQLILGEFEGELVCLTIGKLYQATDGGRGYYRIIDNADEAYLYPQSVFEVKGI